ncbi:MAG: ImmA/IrrE family metallo-endopeptidase [Bacteroidales bacterium]|jgi:Zn-dependent peptidase ImmA (M78 family)|nr:ImmA/IrrE family metallo-endopeptidase [Bacteroidales bacterium]
MNRPSISPAVILAQYNLYSIPVNVLALASEIGIRVFEEALPEDISGILDLRNMPIIMVNQDHVRNRQRFSIAHEIGHFLLHRPTGIHVDKRTYYRNSKSAEGLDDIEIEANRFAAELLMPSDLVIREIEKYSDLIDSNDDVISVLADSFEVSATAMGFRIQNLGYHPF